MRILITGSRSTLGRALVAGLAPYHDVRATDLEAGAELPVPMFVGDPRDREFAARVVAGCDCVVHLAALGVPCADPLERIDAATRGTYNLITNVDPSSRFILISSLQLLERYPMEWLVTEHWAPRPTVDAGDLAIYLAEVTAHEVARAGPLLAICLRMGEVVDDEAVQSRQPDPRWLHVKDAVQAVERALAFDPRPDWPCAGWRVYHIVGAGRRTRFALAWAGEPEFGYVPQHDLVGESGPVKTPSLQKGPRQQVDQVGSGARRVVIYGAGGPLATAIADALAHDHVLRLTDVRPLADFVSQYQTDGPRVPGAPAPRMHGAPHDTRVVDITDAAQVLAAARGMDAIVNCAVVRSDPVQAFRVNVLGAYNVMCAAVRCGIRRVVHTGPQTLSLTLPYLAGYWHDFGVSSEAPARPGSDLYILTKFLGQEICRIFAEEHDLEVPALQFHGLFHPAYPPRKVKPYGIFGFSVSWEDAALAVRQALHVPTLPRPFEVLHISADLPHGKVRNDKAKQLLGWQPRDRLEALWRRDLGVGEL